MPVQRSGGMLDELLKQYLLQQGLNAAGDALKPAPNALPPLGGQSPFQAPQGPDLQGPPGMASAGTQAFAPQAPQLMQPPQLNKPMAPPQQQPSAAPPPPQQKDHMTLQLILALLGL